VFPGRYKTDAIEALLHAWACSSSHAVDATTGHLSRTPTAAFVHRDALPVRSSATNLAFLTQQPHTVAGQWLGADCHHELAALDVIVEAAM